MAAAPADVLDATGAADVMERIGGDQVERGGATLARLTYDSLVAAVLVPGRPRTLIFEVGGTRIDVQVDAGPSRCLHGRVTPPLDIEIDLYAGEIGTGGEVAATGRPDADGVFALQLPEQRSLVSLHCLLPDGTAVETARIRL